MNTLCQNLSKNLNLNDFEKFNTSNDQENWKKQKKKLKKQEVDPPSTLLDAESLFLN
jgi:hypothetical protein